MLSISPGDRVLDVACGPGNFTRDFALAAGDGLVVGLDSSETMLGVAVRDTSASNVAYVRGDARDLPFRDGSFDAVCCFAALYLIEEPMRALAEIVRVLAPGGRLALMSSCNRGPVPASKTNAVAQRLSGVRVFGRDELTGALEGLGAVDVEQRVSGLAQFVCTRRASRALPTLTSICVAFAILRFRETGGERSMKKKIVAGLVVLGLLLLAASASAFQRPRRLGQPRA